MKTLLPFVCFSCVLISTLVTGWLHGSYSDRWGVRAEADRAAESLERASLPEVGNWRLRYETPFSPDIVKMLQCPAHMNRVYEHQQTGDLVTLSVLMGPPGPVSVHTPEICYSSRDYSIDGERRKISVGNTGEAVHTFWELPLKAANADGVPLRVFYGWSSGILWEAAQYPRFSYGGSHLYKLQMAITANPSLKSRDFDPAQDFLNSFLPQLQPYLVDGSR